MSTSPASMTRVTVLLAVWCACLLAPGALMVAGVFGPIGIDVAFSGANAIAWVVGYLVQFAMFMWIMYTVEKQKFLWWFAASLLPWAVDWSVPVSPLFFPLWIAVTAGFAAWIALVNRAEVSLQQHGIRATGTVLEVYKPLMNVIINSVYIQRRLRVRIERSDGAAAYEGVFKGLFMLGEIPGVGDRLPLLVDPENPQRLEYDKNADAEPTTRSRSAPSLSPHASPSYAPTYSSGSSGSSGRANIADDLERLSALRDRGALSDEEFEAAKKKLLHP